MLKRKLFFSLFLLVIAVCAFAVVPENTGVSFSDGIRLDFNACSDGSIRIEATTPSYIAPAKEFELDISLASDNFVFSQKKGTWKEYSVELIDNGYILSVNNKKIYQSTFYVSGKKFVEERQWLQAKDFYGLGEVSTTLKLNGQSFTIWNFSKYGDHALLFVPFFVSNQGDSSYYNANGKDSITFQGDAEESDEDEDEDDEDDYQTFNTRTGRIDSYYKKSDSIKDAVTDFYKLTSSSSLLPKWAFGFIQSKYGYKTQEEVINVVNKFKENDIKLSGIVLDLYWFEKMGDIFWTNKGFPNPKAMDDFLEGNGVKLITITEPFFSEHSTNYKQFADKNFFGVDSDGKPVTWSDWWCLGDTWGSVINPLHKDASNILGEKYSQMIDSGIDGFWTDLGEPENAPATVTYNGIAEQYFHNYFNYYWSKSIFDGVTARKPQKRLFMLSRSGYTGSTAFNVSVWSGDVSVSFDSLQMQVPLALSSGMCGLPFWGSDVGGFVQNRHNDELLVRWYQFGAFTPVYRAHGTGPREPWVSTKENLAIIKKFIDMRYDILPYIYSVAREVETQKLPMMRPMLFESENPPEWTLNTQFTFGDSILVSPVVKPARETKKQKVWLPKGNWYELETLEKVKGNRTLTVKTQIESIPIYLREGAIIPMEHDKKNYLLVLPAKDVNNEFVWYLDDGETNNYKNGDFEERICTLDGNLLKVTGCKEPTEVTLVLPASYKVRDKKAWQKKNHYQTRTVTLTQDFTLEF